jgi:hypothetical protein
LPNWSLNYRSINIVCSEKFQVVNIISAAKAIPVRIWTGPGFSRRLRLPDFKAIGTRRL